MSLLVANLCPRRFRNFKKFQPYYCVYFQWLMQLLLKIFNESMQWHSMTPLKHRNMRQQSEINNYQRDLVNTDGNDSNNFENLETILFKIYIIFILI